MIKKRDKPIEYTLEDLRSIQPILKDVKYESDWATDPKNKISTYYQPAKKTIKKCSFCKKNKEIFIIEGGRVLTKDEEDVKDADTLKNSLYHETFYVLCGSCATARKI